MPRTTKSIIEENQRLAEEAKRLGADADDRDSKTEMLRRALLDKEDEDADECRRF